jgi:hypothetical protein
MRTRSILSLAIAGIILAVTANASALAMIPEAKLIDDPNNDGGLNAAWVVNPSNSYSVYRSTQFTETDKWIYDAEDTTLETEALFAYFSFGLEPTMSQISHGVVMGRYGDTYQAPTTLTTCSTPDSYTMSVSLGFYPHYTGYYYFANPMRNEALTVT